MIIEILHRYTGAVLYKSELPLKVAVVEAVMSGANLSRADLSRANLSVANLSWANLSEANLSRANLRGANLSEADLSRADLRGTNLSRADLSNADLSRANLFEANLFEANLSGVDLRDRLLPDAPKVETLRELVAAHIEACPELHNQAEWGDGTANPSCATPCCVAGWACHLGGGDRGLSVQTAATLLLWHKDLPMPDFSADTSRADILAALRAKVAK